MTCSLVGLAMVLAGVAAPAEAGQFAVVIVPPSRVSMPAVVDVDFAAVAQALGLDTRGLRVAPGDVRAAVEGGDGELEPVPCQYDADGPARGQVVLAPLAGEEQTRVRVYFTAAGPRWDEPPARGAVKIERDGAAVVVDNGFARVRHDPARQGGLPSRWEFLKTGQVFEQFNNNDRLYTSELGGQYLRHCPDAGVDVVSEGPLRTVVRVSAAYTSTEGKQHESKPSAVYEYSYFAGLPYILVRAWMKQAPAFSWQELHFIEINFPGTDFTHWAAGRESGELTGEKRTLTGGGWVAVMDGPTGPRVLAVVGEGARIYDGRGEYGTYLHGPWVSWDGTEREFQVALYADDGPEALSRLVQAEGVLPRPGDAYVSTEELEGLLQALPREGFGAQRVRWAWVASLLRALARADLVGAVEGAREAMRLARDRADAMEWFVASEQFRCAEAGNLGMAWRRDDEGRVRLASLFDMKAKRELLGVAAGPLWTIKAEDAEGREVVVDAGSPVAAGPVSDEGEVRVQWRPLRDAAGVAPDQAEKLVVRLTARVTDEGQAQMELAVDNDSDLSLAEVIWPQLYFGPLGDRAEDDVFLGALGPGKLWRNPYETGARVGGLYPNGWTDMQMMGLYDGRGGLVLMAQDPVATTKHIEAAAEGRTMMMSLRWPAPDHTVAGNDFHPQGRVAVAPIAGDWYDAALVYRAWVESEAQWWPLRDRAGRPDTPEWMRDLPLWALASGTAENLVPAVKAFREYMDVPCAVHWYSWHEIPFDDDYPHYFPTKPGFAEGVKALQEAGVRVMPYINGRLWDSDTDDFPTKALPWATKDRKGDYYVEEYGSKQKLVPMCPTSKLWQETVQGIVKRLVGPECNVDGVYIDQVAAASPRICYDKGHGHALAGGPWWNTQGYWPMLEQLQADLAADFPDKMLTTECTAEPYTHVFDGYLSWHWQEDNAVPLFPVVYGDKVRLFSRAYGYVGDKATVYRMKMAQQWVFGEQLGWLDPNVWKEDGIGPYMRRLAKIRWNLRQYFRGRVLRPPTVLGAVDEVTGDWAWGGTRIVTLKAVQAGALMAETGEVAVVVTNLSDKPQKFELRIPLADYGLADNTSFVRYGEGGEEDRGLEVIDDGRLEMELGPMEAYGLVLAMG